jgi:phosphate butyryltransferase
MKRLSELVELAREKHSGRLAVAGGHDPDTIQATARAAREGLVDVGLVADEKEISALLEREGLDRDLFSVIHKPDPADAAREAVSMVARGDAEMLMKGLVGTDVYMRLILDKEKGILPHDGVLSHVSVLEIPTYHKLLIVADVAVIPCPDLSQKIKILGYCIRAARSLGVVQPKVAIIAATEKVSPKMPATIDAAVMAKMAERGQVKEAVVDGPLALDIALSKRACEIKGVESTVGGDADILIFPNIETGNVFYKAVNVLAEAKTAAVVAGTDVPCVLTSRADDDETKFFSIALAAVLAATS